MRSLFVGQRDRCAFGSMRRNLPTEATLIPRARAAASPRVLARPSINPGSLRHEVRGGPVLRLLQDVYFAEKQLVKALPKMAKQSAIAELEKAFTDHLEQTKGHVERLDQVFELIGKRAKGKRCEAIMGIIAEGEEVIEDADNDNIRDAGILAAAQAAERYEIARYGTLCAWAEELGDGEAVKLLKQTLEEEKEAAA
jgi:ferritin-like metal-binding protein YciE